MSIRTNARIAGFMFLFYIVVGITSMTVFGQASIGEGAAARLASIAANEPAVRLTAVLTLLEVVSAIVLGVTLYALTREVDRELALIALCFRVVEGVTAAASAVGRLGLISLATAGGAAASVAVPAHVLGEIMLRQGGHGTLVAATCFAMGSTLFAWLFLRARSIPVALAWLGVFASILLLVALPARIMDLLPGSLAWPIWMPMLLFEVWLALWLLLKGVRARGVPAAAPAVR